MWVEVEITFSAGNRNADVCLKPTRAIRFTSTYQPGYQYTNTTSALKDEPLEYGPWEHVSADVEPTYSANELARILKYPALALEVHLEGKVTLRVQVDTDGVPRHVIVQKSTNKIFDRNAKKAASLLTYTPAIRDGKPFRMWFTVSIVFKMD